MFVSRVLAAILASIGRSKFRLARKRAGSKAFPDSGTAAKKPNVSRLRPGARDGNAFRSAARPEVAGCGWGAEAKWGI